MGKTVETYKNFNEAVSFFVTKHCQELDSISFFENVYEIELWKIDKQKFRSAPETHTVEIKENKQTKQTNIE